MACPLHHSSRDRRIHLVTRSIRMRLFAAALSLLAILGVALGFGVAQSNVVTESEWAVYLAQGLGIDWNLPPNAKSSHYLARLEWTQSVDFQAAQMLEGSTAIPSESTGPFNRSASRPRGSALRSLNASGGRLWVSREARGRRSRAPHRGIRPTSSTSPAPESRWLDLNRVRLSAGSHKLSLMLPPGTRADAIGVSPPCMLPVEPAGGWQPLEPLHFEEMAVTLAKALGPRTEPARPR